MVLNAAFQIIECFKTNNIISAVFNKVKCGWLCGIPKRSEILQAERQM